MVKDEDKFAFYAVFQILQIQKNTCNLAIYIIQFRKITYLTLTVFPSKIRDRFLKNLMPTAFSTRKRS